MNNEGVPSKQEQRARARGLLKAMSRESQRDQSTQIEKALSAWLTEKDVTSLLVTLPLAGEPDLTSFFRRWFESGRALALARAEADHGLSFRVLTQWDPAWTGPENLLREAPIDAAEWNLSARTVCLVPGLAFARGKDRGFDRLGRGGGVFDRWLEQKPAGLVTMGVGYHEIFLDHLTVEQHDRRVDLAVTADGVLA